MAEQKESSQSDRFSIDISIKQEKLWITLNDTTTKRKFQSSYTSKQLLSCNFNETQAANLDGIQQFIKSAKSQNNGIQFNISIERVDNIHHDADDIKGGGDEQEGGGGAQGVLVTAAAPAKPAVADYAQIVISKNDDFFGSVRYTLKLDEIQRDEKDVNKEIMDDIKRDINTINNKLTVAEQENKSLSANVDKLKQDWTASSSTLSIKVGILNDKLTASQQLGQDLKAEVNDNKEKIKEEMDQKLVDVKKQNEVFVNNEVIKMKEEMNNKFMEEMNKMRQDLKKIESLKSENIGLKQEMMTLKQHSMPKGSIIMWSGSIDSIPEGWRLCDGRQNTPDLRNRFIIGAGSDYNVNSIGGNKTHSHNITVNGHQLTINEIPSHRHEFYKKVWVRDDDKDNYFICDESDTNKVLNYYCSGDANLRTKPIGGGGSHSHTASSSQKSHLPPYFAMAFIVKTI